MPTPASNSQPPLFASPDAIAGHVCLTGVVGFATARQLLADGEQLFAGMKDVQVDMSQVTASDSAGLALLLAWLAYASKHGSCLTFVNIPEQMRAMARISDVEDLLGATPGTL